MARCEKAPVVVEQSLLPSEVEVILSVPDAATEPQSEVLFIEHYQHDEQKDPRVTSIEERLLDYFLLDGRDNACRAELIQNDLVMTNNFSLWINGAEPSEWNMWDYRKEPFAGEFEQLLAENAEAIAEVKELQVEHRKLVREFLDVGTAGMGETATLKARLKELEGQINPRMIDIFRTFAARLLDSGYDLFELCL